MPALGDPRGAHALRLAAGQLASAINATATRCDLPLLPHQAWLVAR